MPPLPCPACRKLNPQKLVGPPELVVVDHYACTSCGHVWATTPNRQEYAHYVPGIRRKPDRRSQPRSGETITQV